MTKKINFTFKKAFTLAEVLIVIGIIGVVAALTLPNLNHATGDKERVTKVKKIYSSLTEAFDRAQAIYGDYDTWFKDLENSEGGYDDIAPVSERFAKRITEFMKISKDCGLETNANCVTDENLTFLDGSSFGNINVADNYKVVTADNMSIIFRGNEIDVDIDGPNKGAYSLGKDVFIFFADSSSGLLNGPSGGPGSGFVNSGYRASSWILENDNADYLKADSTGKCNDSDIVLNWTTNTSCH